MIAIPLVAVLLLGGVGKAVTMSTIGAGLSDSCALCHGVRGDRQELVATW
jgi:hypothetical protein